MVILVSLQYKLVKSDLRNLHKRLRIYQEKFIYTIHFMKKVSIFEITYTLGPHFFILSIYS